MTREEIIKYYNFKTENMLKRLRKNIKRFEHENIYSFVSLILASENYYSTNDQSEATYILIINSNKEFIFPNSVDGDEEPVPLISSFRERSCVLCLSEKPKVLFYDCRYICVCQECEERNPVSRCPVCRTRAKSKIII